MFLAAVASISAGNDDSIGTMIADAVDKDSFCCYLYKNFVVMSEMVDVD